LRELEIKLINRRLRWYRHVPRISENRIPNICNLEIKKNAYMKRSRWEQQVADIEQKKGGTGKESKKL
jgi:hypothetical protein